MTSLGNMFFSTTTFALVFGIGVTAWMPQAQARQHAHVHGVIKLDIAVDAQLLIIQMDSPLDSLLGFEHTPRSAAEKLAVQRLVHSLRAADQRFKINPQAGCTLRKVELVSSTLGLGPTSSAWAASADSAAPPAEPAHGDVDGTFEFNCTNTAKITSIDLGFFDAYPHARQIEVQVATPKGQFKRVLSRPATRLNWPT